MEGAIEVPLFPYALFQALWVGTSIAPTLYLFPMPFCKNQAERQERMKLKIRYENEFQTIELDAKATEEMWVSLSIEVDEDLTQKEKEQFIQDAWDEQYNKPEYNNWHKFDRHRGFSKARPNDETDEIDTSEPLMDEVRDSSIFYKEEIDRANQWEYEALCQKVHEVLKPSAADMVIAIVLDGLTVGEYATSLGEDANNVSHRYRRAINKLKKVISKTSF